MVLRQDPMVIGLRQDSICLGYAPHVVTHVAKAALVVRRAHPSAHVVLGLACPRRTGRHNAHHPLVLGNDGPIPPPCLGPAWTQPPWVRPRTQTPSLFGEVKDPTPMGPGIDPPSESEQRPNQLGSVHCPKTTQLGSEHAPSLITWLGVDVSRSTSMLDLDASTPNPMLGLDATASNSMLAIDASTPNPTLGLDTTRSCDGPNAIGPAQDLMAMCPA